MSESGFMRGQPGEAGQSDVIRFLSSMTAYTGIDAGAQIESMPACCDQAVATGVETISTHSARLFLTGRHVFKIKRAVTYSYLDMSSLETRRRLCQREVELNSVLLPDIYLGVVAICRRADGSLQLGGEGKPVEWAVHMRRFDESLVLDNIARRGALDTRLAGMMGRSIAEFHAGLQSEPVGDGCDRIREVVIELVHELNLLQGQFDRDRLDSFSRYGMQELESMAHRLDSRACDGFVRRCHGDLHLRNLVLHEGVPTPFDALEFDERMSTTDVLYDLAFVIMDLHYRQLSRQANSTLNQYLLYSTEGMIDGLSLLPLFLFCRAGIKAMTSAQRASLEESASRNSGRDAVDYLDLALSYLNKTPPVLVAIGGLSGTGKSTVSAELASELPGVSGAVLLRSDSERKRSMGINETDSLPDDHYTEEASRVNYRLLLRKAERALKAGQSVVVDAVFVDAGQRLGIEQCAREQGVVFMGVWLHAPVDVLRQRVASRVGDASDATISVIDKQLKTDTRTVSWCQVEATGARESVYEQVRDAVNRQRDERKAH
ncbi:MAG: AAA family ATPase [Granulosicoccus sp.]|nr:AAA family ATPase [Granulosicoccus sp.]